MISISISIFTGKQVSSPYKYDIGLHFYAAVKVIDLTLVSTFHLLTLLWSTKAISLSESYYLIAIENASYFDAVFLPCFSRYFSKYAVFFPLFCRDFLLSLVTNQPPKANSAFHPSGVGK